MRTKTRTNKK